MAIPRLPEGHNLDDRSWDALGDRREWAKVDHSIDAETDTKRSWHLARLLVPETTTSHWLDHDGVPSAIELGRRGLRRCEARLGLVHRNLAREGVFKAQQNALRHGRGYKRPPSAF